MTGQLSVLLRRLLGSHCHNKIINMSCTVPDPGALTAAQVRDACTAPSTKRGYKSHLNQISLWVHKTLPNPDQYFDAVGDIDVTVFTPELFEAALLRAIQASVDQLPTILLSGFKKMLDENGVSGSGITRKDLRDVIQSLLQEVGLHRPQSESPMPIPAPMQGGVHLWELDNKFHRLPEDFEYPEIDAFGVWRLWWFGNSAKGYPPFRALQTTDFRKPLRKMYSEWTVLVKHFIAAIEQTTNKPMAKPANELEAHRLYCIGIANVPMKPVKAQYKQRLIQATTTLRRIRGAIHDANPQARVMPFRRRKRQRATGA